MLLAQISDTHLVAAGPRRDARLAAFERAVNFVASLDPRPDALVHSGDLTHNARPEQYELARQVLSRLDIPLIAVPGNRDRRKPLLHVAPPPAERLDGSPFVQFALSIGPVRLIALDTIDEGSGLGSYCEDRFEELGTLLDRGRGQPTVVVLHHPPVSLPSVPGGLQFSDPDTAHRLAMTLARDASIVGVLAGHIHRRASAALGRASLETIPSLAVDLRKGVYPRAEEGRPVILLHSIDDAGMTTRHVTLDPVK